AEGVGLSDAEMHAERRGRHHPAAVAGSCDGMLAIEERQQAACGQARRVERRCHSIPPAASPWVDTVPAAFLRLRVGHGTLEDGFDKRIIMAIYIDIIDVSSGCACRRRKTAKIILDDGVVPGVPRSTWCRRSSRSRGAIEMQYLLMIYRSEA